MEIDTKKFYAVITGDIIGSSKLSDQYRKKLYDIMKAGGSELRQIYPKDTIPLDIDIFRGDSWQLLISDPKTCIRLGLLYRLYIKAYMQDLVDTRMSIAVGRISFIPDNRVGEGEGRAFFLSGEGLESMPPYCSMAFSIDPRDSINSEVLNSIVVLIDAIVSNLTEKQSLALYGALLNLTQKKVASLWDPPIKQQTVAKLLKKAQLHHLESVIKGFEKDFYRLSLNYTAL